MTVTTGFTLVVPDASSPRQIVGGEAPASSSQSATSTVIGGSVIGPFRRDGKGDVANASGLELIRSNVELVLSTIASSNYTLGELPWRPEFGSLLHLLRFRNNDAVLRQLAQQYVIDAVELWEPRVRIKDTRIDQDVDAGLLKIIIVYDVISRRRSVIASGQRLIFDKPLEEA